MGNITFVGDLCSISEKYKWKLEDMYDTDEPQRTTEAGTDTVNKLKSYGISHFRIDFTIENAKEVENVLHLYKGKGQKIEYTNGHYKRGVE